MNQEKRTALIKTILGNEKLRALDRVKRLVRNPTKTLPYYILACAARICPFVMRFKTLWGTQMTCYLPEGNTFYYYGYCEANLTNFLLRYVQPGMQVIDVGAHVGMYSMLTGELVGEEGSVHSFEPTSWTYRLLQENCSSYSNITINNHAVSNQEVELDFADYGPGYGAYNTADSQGAPALKKQATHTKVSSVILDSYITQHSLIPDFIKIDAEGFESEILEGLTETLSASPGSRPLISIEVANEDAWSQNRERSFGIFAKQNYAAFNIAVDGLLVPLSKHASFEYDNIVFVPQEKQRELKTLII